MKYPYLIIYGSHFDADGDDWTDEAKTKDEAIEKATFAVSGGRAAKAEVVLRVALVRPVAQVTVHEYA